MKYIVFPNNFRTFTLPTGESGEPRPTCHAEVKRRPAAGGDWVRASSRLTCNALTKILYSLWSSNFVSNGGRVEEKNHTEVIRNDNITTPPTINYESGNILVTSILILLIMTLLGAGLANIATREWTTATYKIIDSEVHHMTESCSHDVILWFGTQTVTPSSVALTQGNPSSTASKLDGFSYSCTTTYMISKLATSSKPAGTAVGNSGGAYGIAGNQVIKDYYQIASTGAGPKNSSKVINTIISVEY